MNAEGENRGATRKDWLGLGVIALPCLLYAVDLTALNLALPRISEQLRPSGAELLWIVDIYGFLVAGMLVTMGNLGDRIGRRRLLLMGAAAFGVGSVLAAFATSAATLIAARAVLGVAGATLAPSTLSLIRNMFLVPRQRSIAIGIWISSYSVGSALGPLLGGLMLQHFWWGSVFLLAVPVMALLLVVGPFLLPEYRDPAPRRLDLPSVVLSLFAVLSLVWGVKRYAQDGAGGAQAVAVVAGLGLGVLFVRRQRAVADPLIDLALFRVPAFTVSLGTYALATLVAFGAYVLLSQYLQLVVGLTPLEAGLWTLPWSGGFVVGSMAAPALARRLRPAHAMASGLFLAALGFLTLTRLAETGLGGFVLGTTMFSLGLAPVVTLGTDLIVGSAPPERAGAAAALSETSSELGGALGIAVLGSVALALYRAGMSAVVVGAGSSDGGAAARDTLGGAVDAATRLPPPVAAALLGSARGAFTHALQVILGLCSALSVVTAIVVLIALRPSRVAGAVPAARPLSVDPR